MTNSPTFERDGNNIILLQDTKFEKSLILMGNVTCKNGYHSLTVDGSIEVKYINVKNIRTNNIYAEGIDAHHIEAKNINASYIVARNIYANNIDTGDIDARNIDANNIYADDINTHYIVANNIKANDILCEKRIKKTLEARTFAKSFIQNKSELQRKERMPEEKK